MSELVNYSIETDNVILLLFKNGRSLRVRQDQLAQHLSPKDLDKILAAIKLRQSFIRQHMPKAVFVVAAGGALMLIFAGSQVIAWLGKPANPAPQNQPESIKHQIVVVPPASSTPTATPPSETPLAAPSLRRRATKVVPSRPVPRPNKPRSVAASQPIPSVSPAIIPPLSTNLFTGEVLGDSIGPETSPAPSPLPSSPAPTTSPVPSPNPSPLPSPPQALPDLL